MVASTAFSSTLPPQPFPIAIVPMRMNITLGEIFSRELMDLHMLAAGNAVDMGGRINPQGLPQTQLDVARVFFNNYGPIGAIIADCEGAEAQPDFPAIENESDSEESEPTSESEGEEDEVKRNDPMEVDLAEIPQLPR